MKVRMIAVVLILAAGVWLPAVAQQSTAPEPTKQQGTTPKAPSNEDKATAKSECTCCEHMKDQGKVATGDHASTECCPAKEGATANSGSCCEGKEMACGKKNGKDNKTAKNCCSGKGGEMCAKEGKECCGKEALACHSKDGKNCCAGHGQNCCDRASQS